ncbi:uncharacterized protein LOC132737181 [Ruditapes philippinarum]|uniref:uncharacterized protein LOC132737181 n=1 Tax=Ruditapes philippinarum TaxID=129788 RepID=UPI00295C21DB|nr:uncharacterized protein LOC132737181 [Ruditapes philippinarum]
MTSVKCLIVLILLITVAWTSKGDGDLDASKSCAAEGGCPGGAEQDETTVKIPEDLPLKMKTSFHTIAAVEVYRALRAVAQSLEFAYLSLADHPEQSKKVRMTAATAQMLHLQSAELMDKFSVTSAHIVETMIPIILDAVLDLKDEELVKDALDMIIEQAEDMKQEAEKMRDGYKDAYTGLQENIGDVLIWNQHVDNEKKRLKEDMETEKNNLRAAKRAQEELDEEKQAIDNNLEMLQSDRAMFREQAGMAGGNMAANGNDGFIEGMKVGASVAGGIGAFVGGVLGGISDLFNRDKRMEEFKVLMGAYMEAQRAVERGFDRKRNVLSRIHEQRTLAYKHLGDLKKLAIQDANYGDVKMIQNALDQLKTAQIEFTRIIQHWSAIVTTLSVLKSNSKPGKLFLKKIEDPKYVERFQTTLEHEKQGWAFFRNICDSFVRSSRRDIYELYKFLSADIDRMAASKRSERQQEILKEYESDIEITFPVLK